MKTTILRTLAYSDIFDYPLNASEIHHWLISSDRNSGRRTRLTTTTRPSAAVNAATIDNALKNLIHDSRVAKTKSYYHLSGRSPLARLRHQRHRYSTQKLKIANRVGGWLKIIPFVKLVGITGALAMKNCDEHDDIDIFIVTQKNRLWITRFFTVLLIELLGMRRRPNKHIHKSSVVNSQSVYSNKICLNLFLDESFLTLPTSSRNLYTAHEVAQVKLLWERGEVFKQFLSSNSWITSYLPNIKIPDISIKEVNQAPSVSAIGYWLLAILERVAYKFQYWYMKKRITLEKVSTHTAFFHPHNMTRYVTREYTQRLKKLSLKP